MQELIEETWVPWVVCPESGFEVQGITSKGRVPLVQVDEKQFVVGAPFRFRNDQVRATVLAHMKGVKAFEEPGATGLDAVREAAYDRAAVYRPGVRDERLTDLASVPPFLRWCVNSYGTHTLAAVIHDDLITKKRDEGALGSDVVADRFFREMLRSCGTPLFMRWVMWTAVALRTRWKAGGRKAAQLALWGMTSFVGMGGAGWLFAGGRWPWALLWGMAMLCLAGLLWGRQWGAAVVAAVALPLIGPAAVLVLTARFGLWALDKISGVARDAAHDPHAGPSLGSAPARSRT